MGSSWLFSADVSVPREAMAAYLAASADPTRFDGWPRDLRVEEPEPATVAEVLDDAARTKLSELDDPKTAFGHVLTLLLPVDAERINAWVHAPSPDLANDKRAWSHRELALPAFAAVFARGRNEAPLLHEQQRFAAAAILELDPAEALLRARALLDEDKLSPVAVAALTGLLTELRARPSLSTSDWHELLATIESKTSKGLASEVSKVLIAWNLREPPPPRERVPVTGRIAVSPSGRATCRACQEKIAKGELRFGEPAPNAYDDDALKWFHLRCAAAKQTVRARPRRIRGRDPRPRDPRRERRAEAEAQVVITSCRGRGLRRDLAQLCTCRS